MTVRSDIAVIGAGPGGYVAALRAAQLGAKVVVIEKGHVGGVCLNWGCIPTKTLLRTAEVLNLARNASKYGVHVADVALDWPAAQKRKDSVVQRLRGGVKLLLERAGVQLLAGTARFVSPQILEVAAAGGTERIEATHYVIAAGSRPTTLPIPGLVGTGVLTSDNVAALEALPGRMLIVGAGPVGVEFATLFGACGVEITLVEMLPRVLPTLDSDLSAEVERALKKMKVKLYTSSKVKQVEVVEGRYVVTVDRGPGQVTAEVDSVLLAAGRSPNLEELNLGAAGVRAGGKGLEVDEHMRTNVAHIFGVGDVTGGSLLAHVAMCEAVVAVESAVGHGRKMNYDVVPSCIFSWPEVATVGLTEVEAGERGYDVQVGRFPFRANGKALALGEHDGWVKIVAEGKYGQVLGVHVVGPHATDLIQEATMALTLEATLDEFEATIHPHPTLTEAFAEAALAAMGRPLHI